MGDTVLDPFGGTGSTTLAASRVGRSSVSVEVDQEYFRYMCNRVRNADALLTSATFVERGSSSPRSEHFVKVILNVPDPLFRLFGFVCAKPVTILALALVAHIFGLVINTNHGDVDAARV